MVINKDLYRGVRFLFFMDISIIIPALNEENNIISLYRDLNAILKELKKKCEIIFIDDGSTDRTHEEMLKLRKFDKNIKIIKFKKNFGQTAAWDAGFKLASGDLVIVMDADLQNDPNDIPKLINKINEGYDIVSGWRYNRQDTFSKKFFSYFANKLRRAVTGEKIHDSGCSLKIYKKECIKNVKLYGEMHRYITAILSWKGYRIGEIKVNHRPRTKGKTKYSFSRIFKGMMDLLLIVFWQKYSSRPIHIFGLVGSILTILGFLAGFISVYFRIVKSIDMSDTFLPMASIFMILTGLNLLVSGIIADICIKNYYKGAESYFIEKIEK